LPTFLTELKHLLERILRSKKDMVLPPASFYSRLISEINEVGWHSLANINNELTQLQLKQKDAKNREHIINIELSSDYPNTAPKCNCSLPEAVALTWNSKTSNLSDVMTQYSKALEKYEDFWGVMEDIDKNTCVLEPQHPSMAETMRRIAAVKHVSLQINVDPLAPRSVPECQFLGAETAISPLRDKLNLNLHQWNYKLTLRQNLESVLEIKFPSPSTAKKEDLNMECAICYTYRIEEEIPDKVCDGKNCGRPFHASCLTLWLKNVPSNRQTLNTIYGKCPYCEEPITVRIASR